MVNQHAHSVVSRTQQEIDSWNNCVPDKLGGVCVCVWTCVCARELARVRKRRTCVPTQDAHEITSCMFCTRNSEKSALK